MSGVFLQPWGWDFINTASAIPSVNDRSAWFPQMKRNDQLERRAYLKKKVCNEGIKKLGWVRVNTEAGLYDDSRKSQVPEKDWKLARKSLDCVSFAPQAWGLVFESKCWGWPHMNSPNTHPETVKTAQDCCWHERFCYNGFNNGSEQTDLELNWNKCCYKKRISVMLGWWRG